MFAGEATEFSRYGTVDGAMQSGAREAKRLANYLIKADKNKDSA